MYAPIFVWVCILIALTFLNQTEVPLTLKPHNKYLQEKEVSIYCTFQLKCWSALCFWKYSECTSHLCKKDATSVNSFQNTVFHCYRAQTNSATSNNLCTPQHQNRHPQRCLGGERVGKGDNIPSNYRLMITAIPCSWYPPQNSYCGEGVFVSCNIILAKWS